MTIPGPWLDAYPELRTIDSPSWRSALEEAKTRGYREGETIFHEGADCQHFYLLGKGLLRLQRFSPDGHEITLCHIAPGQLCYLTGLSLLAQGRHQAEAIAEQDSELLLIPGPRFREAIAETAALRERLFAAFAGGMADVLTLVEEVAFGDMRLRLVDHLLAHGESRLRITHQELASELGTAREVVSRLLKQLERQGVIRLGRGSIEIPDRAALQGVLPASGVND